MPSTFSSGISIVGVVEPERKTNGKGPGPTWLSYTRAVVVSADVKKRVASALFFDRQRRREAAIRH
jgi:hypothetical protein